MGVEETIGSGLISSANPHAVGGLVSDVGPLQKKDIQALREQLSGFQQKQMAISAAIAKLSHNYNSLSGMFRTLSPPRELD